MEASPAVVETPPSGCWVIERPRRSGAEGSGKQGTEGQQADDGRQGAGGRGSRVVEGEEDSRIWGGEGEGYQRAGYVGNRSIRKSGAPTQK